MSSHPDSCYSDITEYSNGPKVWPSDEKFFHIVILGFCVLQVIIDGFLLGKVLGVLD